MTKINKRVEVVRAYKNHPPEKEYDCGIPVLLTKNRGSKSMKVVGKDIEAFVPTHDCPEWATDDEEVGVQSIARQAAETDGGKSEEGIFRYDARGDQICQNCGYIRNQDTDDVVYDHQHAGRYDGYDSE
jgi:hypothetical protein